MMRRKKAVSLNDKANRLQTRGKLQDAIRLYQEASALDPAWAVPLYNLGLLFKNERRWEESLEYNRRATAVDPSNKAGWWNLGIAATALGRWDVARAAWRGFGVDVPDGEGPVDLPCGFGPIRLNPDGDAEVVWAHRIDPARAVLASIPFPESGHRWGDVVLNDGAPVGYRRYEGKEYPVLNALALLEQSPFETYVARVRLPGRQEDVARLTEAASQAGGSAEDWSTSVRLICRACSEGRPHTSHDNAAAPPKGAHLIAIAARDRQHAAKVLSDWESQHGDVHVEWLDNGVAAGRSNGHAGQGEEE
jgi:tetratricopeptide (TPR) repeat protein